MLLLTNKAEKDTVYERDDLKITLKVFLSGFDLQQLYDAVNGAITQLKTDNIEQLIISFPHTDDEKIDEHTELDEKWFEKVLESWNKIEELVHDNKVVSVGVADFELPALKALYERSDFKPSVNHYNIDGCCVVSDYSYSKR